jgi:aspartate kinase
MNDIVVMKFGGTSVADLVRVRQVVELAKRKREAGSQLVLVVSARAKMTDELIGDAKAFGPDPAPREMDMLLTSGERISASLLSIALNAAGLPAISFTGSQAGIITDDAHTNARIIEIRPYRVLKALQQGLVVVVGGFQGVSFKKDVTTLGRGGSDISAVALASALNARVCEIYSDVDGVYAADPAVIPNPRKIPEMSHQEMQEMAEAGAKVLHPKSVEFAKLKHTIIHAKSTFEPDGNGTIIKHLEGAIKPRVVGVASEEKVVLLNCSDPSQGRPRNVARVMELLTDREVKVKQISFHASPEGGLAGSLVVPERENYHLEAVLRQVREQFADCVTIFDNLAAVSLIGAGITDRHHYLRDALRLFAENSIPVFSFHTSSFRISLLSERPQLQAAIRLLYDHFMEP